MTAANTLPAPQKTTTERQLELTLNAIARSLRKAIRLAEKQDPTGTSGFWKAVEHRAGLMETMLKAAADYARSFAPNQAVAPATPAAAEAESQLPEKARTPEVKHVKAAPRPLPVKASSSAPVAAAPKPAALKTSGPGWRVAV